MNVMEIFVQRQNIKNYTKQLMTNPIRTGERHCKDYWPKKLSNRRATLHS